MKTTAKSLFLFIFPFIMAHLVNAQGAFISSNNGKYLVKDAATGIVLADFVDLKRALEHRNQYGMPQGEIMLKKLNDRIKVNYTSYLMPAQLQHLSKPQLQINPINENAIYNNSFLPIQQHYNYQQITKPLNQNYNDKTIA